MEHILITGITGRSGKHFGELLIKNGINATALIRNEAKFKQIFADQSYLNYEVCDIDDAQALSKLIDKYRATTLFHIAGIKHSLNIVKAALASKSVNRIILVHTTGIYSKFKAASSEYLQIEDTIFDLLKESNISLTILRPTMIYGTLDDSNISKFIKMVDKLPIIPLVRGGKYELQPVNYSDLSLAYYQVLQHGEATRNKNYTLSGGSAIYLSDLLKSISEFLGKRTVFVSVPFWFAFSGAWALYLLSFTRCDFREKVQRLVEPRAYDHEEAKKDFNYSPMKFSDGLKIEVERYKEKYYKQK